MLFIGLFGGVELVVSLSSVLVLCVDGVIGLVIVDYL